MAHLPIPIQGYSCSLGESEGEYCIYEGLSQTKRISTIPATTQIPQFPLRLLSLSEAKHLSSLFQIPNDQCQSVSRIKLQAGQGGQIPRSEFLLSEVRLMTNHTSIFSYI